MSGISGINLTNSFALSPVSPLYTTAVTPVSRIKGIDGSEKTLETQKTKQSECTTCRERKYVDGSNDPNVSFKSPAHISPQNSASVVRSHEQEHVSNAQNTAMQKDADYVSSTVRLTYATCPECGASYVSGGVTSTTMKYSSSPYGQAQKNAEESYLKGLFFDSTA